MAAALQVIPKEAPVVKPEEEPELATFLYFAYGSNLLKKRIHISSPTATFICIGRLDDHRLDFIRYSDRWRGASATIVPTANAHVWGSVWSIHVQDLPNLDEQEGVTSNIYFPKEVTVHTFPQASDLKCRVYQQTVNPPPRGDNDPIPNSCRPSETYHNTIVQGAIDCELPEYYIEMLKAIDNNGCQASPSMLRLLNDEELNKETEEAVVPEERETENVIPEKKSWRRKCDS